MTLLAWVVFPKTPAGAGKNEFREARQRGDVVLEQNSAVSVLGADAFMQRQVRQVFQAGGGRRERKGGIHQRGRTIVTEPSDDNGDKLLADRFGIVPVAVNLLPPVHGLLRPGDRKRLVQHF